MARRRATAVTYEIDTFGGRLRSAREARGYTVNQLAQRAGVSGAAVSRYENKKRRPRADEAVRLARGLRCSVAWLVGVESAAPDWVQVIVDPSLPRAKHGVAAKMKRLPGRGGPKRKMLGPAPVKLLPAPKPAPDATPASSDVPENE